MNYKYNIGDRVRINEHLDTPESIFTYLSPIMREMSGNVCRVRERDHYYESVTTTEAFER